jgi:hypothetical protein
MQSFADRIMQGIFHHNFDSEAHDPRGKAEPMEAGVIVNQLPRNEVSPFRCSTKNQLQPQIEAGYSSVSFRLKQDVASTHMKLRTRQSSTIQEFQPVADGVH